MYFSIVSKDPALLAYLGVVAGKQNRQVLLAESLEEAMGQMMQKKAPAVLLLDEESCGPRPEDLSVFASGWPNLYAWLPVLLTSGVEAVEPICLSSPETGEQGTQGVGFCFDQLNKQLEQGEIEARFQFYERILHSQQNWIRLAMGDALTGLPNRRALQEVWSHEIASWQNDEAASGLTMVVDIDRFKSINDIYGHAAGDEAIRKVGEVLGAAGHFVARLGGDEFAVIAFSSNPHDLLNSRLSLLKSCSNIELNFEGEKIIFDLTVGTSLIRLDEERRLSVALNKADMDLIRLKTQKRKAGSALPGRYQSHTGTGIEERLVVSHVS